MPLYKPKFLTPGGENKTIDLQDDNPKGIEFSCIVDGNVAIKKYKVDIWLMSDENTHFTKTVTLTSSTTPSYPFFPINERNEYNLFQFYLSEAELANANIVNSVNPYKWQISMWADGNEDNSSPDTVSCEEVFYGNKIPALNLTYKLGNDYIAFDDTPLKSKVISFKGIYFQEQNIPLQRFGWYIKSITTGKELFNTIDEGKMVYGSASNITLTFDGFLNNEDYLVKCKIVTQNGVELETSQTFSVNYDTYDVTSDFAIEMLPNESGNLLSWGNVRAITGRAYDNRNHEIQASKLEFKSDYPVENHNSIVLSNGNKVIFEEGTDGTLDISEESTIVYSGQFENGNDRVILEMEGTNKEGKYITLKFEIKDKKFVYTVTTDGMTYISEAGAYIFNSSNWFIITMFPLDTESVPGSGMLDFVVVNRKTVGALYPSTSLFPTAGVFSKFGVWDGES